MKKKAITQRFDINRLKAKFDPMPIQDIEAVVEMHSQAMAKAQFDMVSDLFYLERTARFKENPQYAKASFDTYLKDRFDMTVSKYRNWRKALDLYYDVVEDVGIGPVVEGIRKSEKITRQVIDEYREAAPKLDTLRKKKVLFDQTTKKRFPKEGNASIRVCANCLHLEKENMALKKELAEARCQIEKLKRTVATLSGETIGQLTATLKGVAEACALQ